MYDRGAKRIIRGYNDGATGRSVIYELFNSRPGNEDFRDKL